MEEIGARPKETVDLHSLQNRSTQTDYRESETQTLPWAPPISSHSASLPEILTLASLSYDTMERDEWLFRETEIQTINEMRLSLAQQILKEIQQRETDNLNDRLQRYWLSKQEEKKRKIEKIRNTCNREHRDHRSELYGPQMRFGEHPKRRHEVINVRSRFLTHIKGLEILETMPSIGQQPTDHLTSVPQKKGYELCVRETRWTEAVLKQLHQDLRGMKYFTGMLLFF
ncbi:hypothetical protein C0J52_17055 [Blattella germanica]|nr:hypothetical protein C0J52_17055 [Blattella germanica]